MCMLLYLAIKDSDMTEVMVMLVPFNQFYVSKSIIKIKPMGKRYLS